MVIIRSNCEGIYIFHRFTPALKKMVIVWGVRLSVKILFLETS